MVVHNTAKIRMHVLVYAEVPHYFTCYKSRKQFQRRKQGQAVNGQPNLYSTDALGRLYTIHPNNAECYYLRLLLINVRGPTSFENLKTINNILYATYREAYQQLKLLENDQNWDDALADASLGSSSHQIRTLFAIIIATCFSSNPINLWEKHKDSMTDDILHQARITTSNPDQVDYSRMSLMDGKREYAPNCFIATDVSSHFILLYFI